MKSKLFHSLKCNSFVFFYKKQISANSNVKKIHYSSEIGYDIGNFYYLPGLLAFLIGTFPAVQTTVPIFPAFYYCT